MEIFLRNKKISFAFLLIAVFFLYFFLSYVIPINKWDDVGSTFGGITGGDVDTSKLLKQNGLGAYIYNTIQLQIQEYFTWQGRFFTNIFIRFVLNAPEPFPYIVSALVILIILCTGALMIAPQSFKKQQLFPFAFYFFLCSTGMFVFYLSFLDSYVHLYSSYFSSALVMLYFLPYFSLLTEKSYKPPILMMIFLGLFAGASHEMAAAGLPMLVIFFILLKYLKIPSPSWFWVGIPFYIIGVCSNVLAPGNVHRLSVYGSTQVWSFMGLEYNWHALGIQRYFYSFIRHIFLRGNDWSYAPGWLPSTWHWHLVFFAFWSASLKKRKYFHTKEIVRPLTLYVFSWTAALVFSFSPMMHWNSLEMVRLIFFTALGAAIWEFFHIYSLPEKIQKTICTVFFVFPFICSIFFVPPLYKASKEFHNWKKAVQQGLDDSQKIEARLFGIPIFHFNTEATLFYLKKQNSAIKKDLDNE